MGLFGRKNSTKPELQDRFTDSNGIEWISQYHYDTIEVKTTGFKKQNYSVNQLVKLIVTNVSDNMSELDSVEVVLDDSIVGYILSTGQRRMIRDYQREDHLVLAQISELSFAKISLRIYYYQSKASLERKKAQHEAEKNAYKRMKPRAFTTTLTGNKSEQMQFELSHGKIGMEVECNEDGERYLVETQDSWQLGYLPKKISNEIEGLLDLGYEICRSKIVNVIEEQGKRNVQIRIDLIDTNYQ